MAALSEGFVFCETRGDESDIISVEETTNANDDRCVIITSKTKYVNVYKVQDQRAVHSWRIRQGQIITSGAVHDALADRYLAVETGQDVRTWSNEDMDLENAKRKHLQYPVHRLFALPQSSEPVVLFQSGAVSYLSLAKEFVMASDARKYDSIIWSAAHSFMESFAVLYMTKDQNQHTIHWSFNDSVNTSWTSKDIELPVMTSTLLACSSMSRSAEIAVLTLWANGELWSTIVPREGDSAHSKKMHTLSCLGDKVSMVTVCTSHIAVTGVQKDGTDGIGVFDLRFGMLQSWKSLAAPIQSHAKIFYAFDHLFVPCSKTLYAFPIDCQPSSVSHLLGQATALNTPSQSTEQHATGTPSHAASRPLTWNSHHLDASTQQEENHDGILNLFVEVTSSSQTKTHAKFKKAFARLMKELAKTENHLWRTSVHMSPFISRVLNERQFWPQDEILHLITDGFIQSCHTVPLFEALLQHEDLKLMYMALRGLSNIPEECLIRCLNCFLRTEDKNISKVSNAIKADIKMMDENEKSPISTRKALFVNLVLTSPFNDVFLLECLRSLKFETTLVLLSYLYHLLGDTSAVYSDNHTTGMPSISQIVDWLCLVLDAHITQLILSPDAHSVLINLHQVVQTQVENNKCLVSLGALLSQLKTKCALPKKQNVGQYCIEVLHVL